MKKDIRWMSICFLFIVLVLSSCGIGQSKQMNKKENEEIKMDNDGSGDGENNTNENEDVFIELEIEEAKMTFHENIQAIVSKMQEIQDENIEWYIAEWTSDPSLDEGASKEAFEIIRERLEDYTSDQWIENNGYFFLEIFWCGCGGYRSIIFESEDPIRFQITDQTEDWFQASYIVLADEYIREGGTRIIEYIKENDQWKLHDDKWLTINEEPLNVTFEEINENYKNYNFVFLEEIEVDGEVYIVVESEGSEEFFPFIFNTRDSSMNFDLMDEYIENFEAGKK